MITGTVGAHKIKFFNQPLGAEGEIEIEINGRKEVVYFKRDRSGIWIRYDDQLKGYDWRQQTTDSGNPVFDLLQRYGNECFEGIRFVREGEDRPGATGTHKAKSQKIKSQMPGKILKIAVTLGQEIQVGQTLLYMEAMKMENEIKSPISGSIKKISVETGQNIETGAELIVIEST